MLKNTKNLVQKDESLQNCTELISEYQKVYFKQKKTTSHSFFKLL